jgi:hypothetical protein
MKMNNFLETAAEVLNILTGRKSWEMVGSGEGIRNYPLEKARKDPTAQDPNGRSIDLTNDIIESDDVANIIEEAINTNALTLDKALDLLYDYRKEQVITSVENFKRLYVKSHEPDINIEIDFADELKGVLESYLKDT